MPRGQYDRTKSKPRKDSKAFKNGTGKQNRVTIDKQPVPNGMVSTFENGEGLMIRTVMERELEVAQKRVYDLKKVLDKLPTE